MNILRYPLIKTALKNRWPQFTIMLIALAGFLLAILSGLFGTPVGSRNFGIVFVWIAWWAILMLVAVPFLGRGWCSICPIPAPGEWLQRGKLLGPDQIKHREHGVHRDNQKKNSVFSVRSVVMPLNKRWPNHLRNIWLQNGHSGGALQHRHLDPAQSDRHRSGGLPVRSNRGQPGLRAEGFLPLSVPGWWFHRAVLATCPG